MCTAGFLDLEQGIPFALKDGGESRQPEHRMPAITKVQRFPPHCDGLFVQILLKRGTDPSSTSVRLVLPMRQAAIAFFLLYGAFRRRNPHLSLISAGLYIMFCSYLGLQEASSALAEVLPRDVASSLVHLWESAMTGGHLSTFCETLEEQVNPSLRSLYLSF